MRKTGLTTLFDEFVRHALRLFDDLEWLIFAGPGQTWTLDDPRVQVVRKYPANDRLGPRLFADHFLVPAEARRLGASALLTVGFAPLRRCLPTIMHLFSLQHLDRTNRVGLAPAALPPVCRGPGRPRGGRHRDQFAVRGGANFAGLPRLPRPADRELRGSSARAVSARRRARRSRLSSRKSSACCPVICSG